MCQTHPGGIALAIAALAGLIQGVVEWLPVSSKTMITLVFAAGGYSFATAYVMGLLANFGSFFAALWYFRGDVLMALRGLRHPLADAEDARLLRYLVVATLATGIIGLPIYAVVSKAFSATSGAVAMIAIGVLLLITSGINLWRERVAKGGSGTDIEIPGFWLSAVVGACQGVAALPGISRSAITVTPLLLSGATAARALRLSFLLDVLGLLGAGLVPIAVGKAGLHAVSSVGVGPVLVMIVVAAVASFLVISGVLRYASRLRSSVLTAVIGALTIVAALVVPR